MNFSHSFENQMELHPWGVSSQLQVCSPDRVRSLEGSDLMLMEPSSGYGSRYLDLRNDRPFKYTFGKGVHKDLLIDFLNSLSEGRRLIGDLRYGAVERQGDTNGTRAVLYDLQCTSDQGEQFLIEMQQDRKDGFFERLLYYAMRLGSEQIPAGKEGDNYPLPAICAVAIVNYDPWKDVGGLPARQQSEYMNVFRLENIKWKHSYPSSFELMLVELPRFSKGLTELHTQLDRWLYLMKNLPHLRERPSSFDQPIFQKLFQITELNNLRGKDRKMIIDHERDLRNVLNVKRREGREEGLERGKLISVQILIQETDLDDREIASRVGLDENLVRRTRHEIIHA